MDLTLRKTQARYRRRSRWHISELAVVLRELTGVCGLVASTAALAALLADLAAAL